MKDTWHRFHREGSTELWHSTMSRERGQALYGVRCSGLRPGWLVYEPYPLIVWYPVGTVAGRYGERYCLIHGGEGDHHRVLPEHRQLHLIIHLWMKEPGLRGSLLPLSHLLLLTYGKTQNPSWPGAEGAVRSLWLWCWNLAFMEKTKESPFLFEGLVEKVRMFLYHCPFPFQHKL